MIGEQATDDFLDIILQRAEAHRALAEAARRHAQRRMREARQWEALARQLQNADTRTVAPLRPVKPRRASV